MGAILPGPGTNSYYQISSIGEFFSLDQQKIIKVEIGMHVIFLKLIRESIIENHLSLIKRDGIAIETIKRAFYQVMFKR